MATRQKDSYVNKLRSYCTDNSIEQPKWVEYSDVRGHRTAWSASVIVHGREYSAPLWRDYPYLDQCREEAAEKALKALQANGQSYYLGRSSH